MNSPDIISLSSAPQWGLTTGAAGRVFIIAGAVAFLISLIGAFLKRDRLSNWMFVIGSLTLFGAFACLASLFVGNQYEFKYIYEHGDVANELKYKIASVWSGQQGSFLLWAVTSAIFGLLTFSSAGIYRRWYVAIYAVFLGSLCGILAYETPFGFLDGVLHQGRIIVPTTGAGLAPSLQNYWVVIHPPTIFLGFGSLTVMFCYAVSAMLTGNLLDWARLVRPWALVSVAVLGLGICMGGMWAYETLGWGGFWAWDPVENTSFVPWLMVVGLLHALIVQTTKGRWLASTLLLGGLPFITFVYGTFLTRSGYLQNASLHSFAEMQRSALWILLALLVVSVFGFMGLWIARGVMGAKSDGAAPAYGREWFYKIGVYLITMLGAAVAIGMSIPFFMAIAKRDSKVVQEPLYHLVVSWFFLPIIFLVAIVPFVSWQSLGKNFWPRVRDVFCVTIGLTGVGFFLCKLPRIGMPLDPTAMVGLPFKGHMPLVPWMLLLMFLCIFALVGNIWRIAEMSKRAKVFSFGGFVAHIGVAVLMGGLIISRGFERSEQVVAQPGEPVSAFGYTLIPGHWQGLTEGDKNGKLPVEISNADGLRLTALPGLYWLPTMNESTGQPNSMRWPFIDHSFSHDLYLSLGDPIMTVYPGSKKFEKGQTDTNKMFKLTYNGFEMHGKPGQMGTRFEANVDLTFDGQVYHPKPGLTMTANGLQEELADAGPDFYVTMSTIEAGTGAANLQVYFRQPIYPMELFYKPLTSLVWIGAGILTLGGLMAAFYRRPKSKAPNADEEEMSAVGTQES